MVIGCVSGPRRVQEHAARGIARSTGVVEAEPVWELKIAVASLKFFLLYVHISLWFV